MDVEREAEIRKNVTDKNTMKEYLDERSSTGDKGDRIIRDEVDIEKDHESSSSLSLEDGREVHLLASISNKYNKYHFGLY